MSEKKSANWQVVPDESNAEQLVIRDLGGDQHPSVTNDANMVVIGAVAAGLLKKGMRFFYYDSEGKKDEILFDERGFFRGFATTNERNPTIYVALAKGEANLRCQSVNLKVETTGGVPDFGLVEDGWVEKSTRFFDNQAKALAEALFQTLPGGTIIALTRQLLVGNLSHYRVPLVETPIEPKERWLSADQVAILDADSVNSHWWWWDGDDGATIPVYLIPTWPAGKESPMEAVAPPNQHGWNRPQELPQWIQKSARFDDVRNEDVTPSAQPVAVQHLMDVITSIKVAIDKAETSVHDFADAGALVRQLDRILSTVPAHPDFSVTLGDIATAVRRERECWAKVQAPYTGEANELEDATRAVDALIGDIPRAKTPAWVSADLLPTDPASYGNWWMAREGKPTINVELVEKAHETGRPYIRWVSDSGAQVDVYPQSIEGAMFLPNPLPADPLVLLTPAPDVEGGAS